MTVKRKRQKWIHVRVTEEEDAQMRSAYQKTTFRMFSDYLRTVLLHQPIPVYYRSQTADDFLAVMLRLKAEMTDIGKNFNQVVKKINIAHSDDQLGLYLFDLQGRQHEIENKVKEMYLKMDQIFHLLEGERDHLKGEKIELTELASIQAAAADRLENRAGQ